jgi:RiboL-PSP-HEPN
MPDFQIADSEFDRQTTILDVLIETIDTSARQDGINKYEIGGAELPIMPAGAQNTMAAAAIVLLAAHFEEFVRQQIEEYAKAVIVEYAHLGDEFREKFVDIYWRTGSIRLNRIRPKGFPTWSSSAEPILRSLIEYPVSGNISAFKPGLISEHDNNMRWDTICELGGRVGVKALADLLQKARLLRSLIDNPRKDQFGPQLQRKINEFYELRNGIIHSISQNAGVGASVFKGWSEFFRVFTTAFSSALDESYKKFKEKIEKEKDKRARAAS